MVLVIVRKKPTAPGLLNDFREEVQIDVRRADAGQIQDPAEQEVVLVPLAEEAFASDAVEGGQDLRFQKHLRLDGLATPIAPGLG